MCEPLTGEFTENPEHPHLFMCIPGNACFEPQKLYGTYVVIPPRYIIPHDDSENKHKHRKRKKRKESDDSDSEDDEDSEEEEETKALCARNQKTPLGKPNCIPRNQILKVGTFSFPAKNFHYHPRQTLEGTVLELYKTESYPNKRLC